LTERLPKPNYSPLRYRSETFSNNSMVLRPHRAKNSSVAELKLSLPPINAKNGRSPLEIHEKRHSSLIKKDKSRKKKHL